MGPEIVALIVIGGAILGVGTPAALYAKIKHSKSKKTSQSHEHDVEMTTIVETRADGTKIVTTTHKGHLAHSSSHEEDETHQRNGSAELEKGVGKAIAALPSMATAVITAGLSTGVEEEAGGVGIVSTIVDTLGDGVSDHEEDGSSTALSTESPRSLPRTSSVEGMKAAIMQARLEEQAKRQVAMQFAMQKVRAEQEVRMETLMREQARRDAEQDAARKAELEAHRAEMEAMQDRIIELESKVSSSDDDTSTVLSSRHETPRHHEQVVVVNEGDVEADLASPLTEEALRKHNDAMGTAFVASRVLEEDGSTASSRDTSSVAMKKALIAWKAQVGLGEVEVEAVSCDASTLFDRGDSDIGVEGVTPQSSLHARSPVQHVKVKELLLGAGMAPSDSTTSLTALAGSGILNSEELGGMIMGDVGSPTPVTVDVSA